MNAPRDDLQPLLDASLRGQGITARLVAPSRGIIKGRSAVVNTERIDRLTSREGGWHAVFDSGRSCRVSRRRTRALRDALGVD